ncbi:MAG: LytTR family transcriptional regulator [Nitrospina sp.]|nr:LytTR family transcriptional regulator [Nitrospina sp.]
MSSTSLFPNASESPSAALSWPEIFWQIHRGTIVNVSCISGVSRSMTGRGVIRLKDVPESLTISRSCMRLFKQM